MKKIYLLLIVSFITFGMSFGQSVSAEKAPAAGKKLNKNIHLNPNQPNRFQNKNQADRAVQTNWVSYADAMKLYADELGSPSEINPNFLMADSTVQAPFGDGNGGTTYSSPYVHSLGEVLDVTSQYIKTYNGVFLDNTTSYTVDSMGVVYTYNRVAGSTETDTLVVTYYNNSTGANLPTYYFTGMAADFGSDTVYFKAQKYLFASNKPDAVGSTTIKIPLTINDTANYFWATKIFGTSSFAVPAGKLLAVGVTYKPGKPYTLADTLDKQVNSFTFASYEENGASTFPVYTYCPTPGTSASCDRNVCSFVGTDVRYNLDPSPGWNGLYVPVYAYTAPFGFEHHLFSYKITYNSTLGINDISATDNITLSQNTPNPATGNTSINYELAQSANVAIEITDITGKKVMTFGKGKQAPGKYNIIFDANQLESGVYFYTLKTDNSVITKKMSVIK